MASGWSWKRTAARIIAFLATVVFVFVLLVFLGLAYVSTTGEQFIECDYADCGTTGQFVYNHGLLFLGGFAGVALAVGWAVARHVR